MESNIKFDKKTLHQMILHWKTVFMINAGLEISTLLWCMIFWITVIIIEVVVTQYSSQSSFIWLEPCYEDLWNPVGFFICHLHMSSPESKKSIHVTL